MLLLTQRVIHCVQVITLTEQAELAESYERRVKSLETEMQTATKKLQSEKKKNSAFGEAASKACETLQTKVKSLNQELCLELPRDSCFG